jgi:hypothetical protein
MQLTDIDILEFQTMCRDELGMELSWEEAQDQAIKLVRLIQVVHRPMSIEEYEAIRNQDQKDEAINEDEDSHDNSMRP